MRIAASLGAVAGVLMSTASLSAAQAISPELRERAVQYCTGDAMRLCMASIMDEGQTTQCMKANRSQLSPPCRAIVDQGLRAQRR